MSTDKHQEHQDEPVMGDMTRKQLLHRAVGAAGVLGAVGFGDAWLAPLATAARRPAKAGSSTKAVIASQGGSSGANANPYLTENAADRNRDRLIYEALGQPTPDGTSYEGLLAKSATPNHDATVWTIKLQPAKFSDGTPFTSADVVYTFQTLIKDPTIVAFQSFTPQLTAAKITAVDAHTVKFAFKEPYPDALGQALYTGEYYIIKNKDTAFKNGTIGTGPFMLKVTDPWSVSAVGSQSEVLGCRQGTPSASPEHRGAFHQRPHRSSQCREGRLRELRSGSRARICEPEQEQQEVHFAVVKPDR